VEYAVIDIIHTLRLLCSLGPPLETVSTCLMVLERCVPYYQSLKIKFSQGIPIGHSRRISPRTISSKGNYILEF
jgi:hypothetical protein